MANFNWPHMRLTTENHVVHWHTLYKQPSQLVVSWFYLQLTTHIYIVCAWLYIVTTYHKFNLMKQETIFFYSSRRSINLW